MKNTLLTIGAVAIAYALYRQWANGQDKAKKEAQVKAVINNAVATAKSNVGFAPEPSNAQVFGMMRGNFNAEESATVAPSIKAKIGIF